MRSQGIWYEAIHDLAVGTTRAATFATILAIIVGLLAIGDVHQIHSIVLRARDFQAKGASISVMSAAHGIDPVACDALKDVPGIRAAGAMRSDKTQFVASTLPAGPIPSARVTPGFAQVLQLDQPSGEGILVSEEVAKALKVQQGSTITTKDGDVTVQGVFSYPSDGRRAGYGYSVLIPTTSRQAFDECWIDVWPSNEELTLLAHTTVIPGSVSSDNPARLDQLNTSLGRTFDSQSLINQRLTRWFPVAGVVIGMVIGYLSIRVRRLEVASNLHAGVQRWDQRTILGLETIAWVVMAAIIASAIIAYAFVFHIRAMDIALVLIAAKVLFPTIGAVLVGAWGAWLTIREKHLFQYFKNR